MKKIILSLALTIGMVVSASAQKAGDQSVNVSFGYETSNSSVVVSMDSESITETMPGDDTFAIGLGYGKFIKDNIRVGVDFGYTETKYNAEDYKTNGIFIAPNIAYYMPIAKNIYYTPCVSAGYLSMDYIEEDGNSKYSEKLSGYAISISLLAFEYRHSEKLAVNLDLGSFVYNSVSYNEDDVKLSINSKVLNLLSNVSVGVSLYF